ncbi:hypothetical protein KUTeg_014890 [Tegillarca granosa]|uniref:DDE Tnp4 domain-containing protein n=1 Tax=Tegillarca granosa TaxID=220873 RepID=A0ABQ9ES81_TEGGR|nr:hypothetical protein KUTeg_014890 [Tegillarca granosa]
MSKCLQGQYHMLGDAAYPITPFLMTPYKNNGHLINEERLYNTELSKRRIIIEDAFGVLKRRFRRLREKILI